MKRLALVGSVGIALVIGVLVSKLALAPFWDRYNAEECRKAYAEARTRMDTVKVDFRPSGSSRSRSRCSEVRGVSIDSAHQLPGLAIR